MLGIAQAAFHAASLVAHRFSVVTTLARTIPTAEHLLQRYGLAERCCAIRAIELPVLALEQTDNATFQQLLAACRETLHYDGAEASYLAVRVCQILFQTCRVNWVFRSSMVLPQLSA